MPRSMYTLFVLMTLDEWPVISRMTKDVVPQDPGPTLGGDPIDALKGIR